MKIIVAIQNEDGRIDYIAGHGYVEECWDSDGYRWTHIDWGRTQAGSIRPDFGDIPDEPRAVTR